MTDTVDAVEPQINMAELFARDPLELTDQDIDTIIADMRSRRKQFKTIQKTGAKPKAQPKKTKAEVAVEKMGLDLGDIKL